VVAIDGGDCLNLCFGVRKPETRNGYRNSREDVIEPLSLKVQEKDRSLGRGLWSEEVLAGDPGARSLL
jgi:hypothetical protein